MTSNTFSRRLLAAALASGLAIATFTAQAQSGADIVKCIGKDGRITLTDEGCRDGERSVTVVQSAKDSPNLNAENETGSPAAAPTFQRTAYAVRNRLPDASVVRASFARLDPPSRSLARDVATLKAARRALELMDGAASAMQSNRIALH